MFNTTINIDGTTPVTVTLSPNVMGEGSIHGGVVISGLMPDTLYTYTVSFVYNNIMYSTQSTVTTLTAPTTATSISGILQGLHTLINIQELVSGKSNVNDLFQKQTPKEVSGTCAVYGGLYRAPIYCNIYEYHCL